MSKRRARPDSRVFQRGLPGKVGAPQRAPRSLRVSVRKLPSSPPPDPRTQLLTRLETAEDTLRAIQSGEVDALMVSGRRGEQVVSLKGGERAYRMLVEAMSEGAATLSRDGAVLYCNGRFAELIGRPPAKIIGMRFSYWWRRPSETGLKLCLPRRRRRSRKANSTCFAQMEVWFRSICLLTGFVDTKGR